jgi:hypothetical protein
VTANKGWNDGRKTNHKTDSVSGTFATSRIAELRTWSGIVSAEAAASFANIERSLQTIAYDLWIGSLTSKSSNSAIG